MKGLELKMLLQGGSLWGCELKVVFCLWLFSPRPLPGHCDLSSFPHVLFHHAISAVEPADRAPRALEPRVKHALLLYGTGILSYWLGSGTYTHTCRNEFNPVWVFWINMRHPYIFFQKSNWKYWWVCKKTAILKLSVEAILEHFWDTSAYSPKP